MRLLVLSNHYPPHSTGSYELQCFQVCHELIRRGYRIHVLTAKTPREDHASSAEEGVARELELYEEEPAASPTFHRLFQLVKFNRKMLERQLTEFLPDVIMIWGMDRLPTSLLQMVEASGIPCLYAVYDHWLGEACSKDRWLSYWNGDDPSAPPTARNFLRGLHLDRMVQKRAAFGELETLQFGNIYFCSESLKRETINACGLPLQNGMVIPCAVSPGEIRMKEGQHATQNCRLLFIARLSEEKDPITALRALQELRHRGDERFTLDIYGRGQVEFEASLHDYVRRFQLGGSISFKPTPEEHVHLNIHLYDGLIFTSKYPEPFPLAHLKAMAAGVPVISTLEGGCAELIRHRENGLAFETSNPYDLADQIAYLADQPVRVEEMVKAAHAEVSQHYSLARITSRVESLIHRAAKTEGSLKEAV